jgi:transcriptional regulator with XRE-family HTH domain
MPLNPANAIDRHMGEQLRARRLLLRMSAAEAAARLGRTEQVLAEFESGALRMDPLTLYRLSGLLGVSVRYFYQGLSSASVPAPRASAG